jgi:hypothetical protein
MALPRDRYYCSHSGDQITDCSVFKELTNVTQLVKVVEAGTQIQAAFLPCLFHHMEKGKGNERGRGPHPAMSCCRLESVKGIRLFNSPRIPGIQ